MAEFKAHFKSVQPDLGGSLPGRLIFGIPGKDGGYYLVAAEQVDANTIRFTFTPSQKEMPKVDPIDIELPGATDERIEEAIKEYLQNNPAIGQPGKSAYEYAKDGGYTGTEAEFAAKLAEEYPDVPEWAMADSKPSYSKSEVGLGSVDNVRQYSASNPPPYPVASVNGQTGKVQLGAADVGARPSNWMPTAQEVGALPDTYVPPNQTAAQVGADPAGTAAAVVSAHNTSTDSHGDLRLELKAINDRLTAFFDSDDTTLDELSEIVAYITSNKSLIDSITTSKVSVEDIINNLTTNVANKPLSAAQGVALKGLIDAVSNSLSNYQPKGDYALRSELPTVPTKVSQLQNDKGYLTEHQDISGKLDADKLPEAVNTALAQAKDSGEFDGDPGAPGVTPHIGSNGNWYIGSADAGVKAQGKDGTSVTVKSVSESTADGGSNVVTFSDGNTLTVKNGKQGSAGKTPVRGVDYYTEADKAEFSEYIASELEKRGQLKPEFANSIEECTDTTKLYVLPDGYIYGYILKEGVEPEITIEEKTGGYWYYNDSGKLTFQSSSGINAKLTNMIPVTPGDQLSYKGQTKYGTNKSVYWFSASGSIIASERIQSTSTPVVVTAPANAVSAQFTSFVESASAAATLVVEWVLCQAAAPTYRWASTGHAFVPADYENRIAALESSIGVITSPLKGKKIVYDGDSICYGAGYKGGYAKIIAEVTGGHYVNQAVGGGRLVTRGSNSWHSVVDNLANLPTDGDIFCFQGGINDYWTSGIQLGTVDYTNFAGTLDTTTVCGALESIFRYALNTFVGKPICFVITHKIQETAYKANTSGNTFQEYHDAMVAICEKYSIPYYDAFGESGLNGWNTAQNNAFLTGSTDGTPDGCHPNEAGYKRYYVPQLISLFERIIPTT